MKPKIFDHNSREYSLTAMGIGENRFNGAYYYSKEIVENIIPRIETDRNWVTINVSGRCYDHSIVFIHNNNLPQKYDWLRNYKDLVLVCGVPSTVSKIQERLPMHHAIYLPLSIDTEYVKKFKKKERRGACFAGRLDKKTDQIPKNCDILGNIPREELLEKMSNYYRVYAVGRCAIEAKALGCKIGIYDSRYPKDIWNVMDNETAALILQANLDMIDKKEV